jgi:short-subunit dehydrogenase
MKVTRRIVIVGATSRIAEHCARLWAEGPATSFVLVGRHADKLEAVAQDLRVRGPASEVEAVTADFESPAAISELVDKIIARAPVDIVLIAHGQLPDQQACERDLAAGKHALVINGLSPVLFAEGFAGAMQRAGRGTIAVIGSVAGDRGRKSNYVYGAAKGMVERYLQGMQHRFAGSGVKLVLVKPGPTDTPMTAQIKAAGGRVADVRIVAKDIINGIAAGKRQVYTPQIWAVIMLIVRNIPQRVFDKLNL